VLLAVARAARASSLSLSMSSSSVVAAAAAAGFFLSSVDDTAVRLPPSSNEGLANASSSSSSDSEPSPSLPPFFAFFEARSFLNASNVSDYYIIINVIHMK
jgi:hypothetical protein